MLRLKRIDIRVLCFNPVLVKGLRDSNEEFRLLVFPQFLTNLTVKKKTNGDKLVDSDLQIAYKIKNSIMYTNSRVQGLK